MINSGMTDRIDEYLSTGGLFNPEHMEHDKVRDLLMLVREYIKEIEYDNWQKFEALNDCHRKIDRYQRVLRVALES